MESYEIYILILAIMVFVIFTALFSIMIAYITKYALKLIRYGDDDEIIQKKREYIMKKPSKPSVTERVLSLFLSILIIAIFILTLFISCTENDFETGLSSVKVVKSDSMATKNEKNKYLFENNLNDQFAMFDVVITHPLPPENEIGLYDIAVYERDGMLVIHRVVGIEEPNEKHSERYFLFQGDAVSRHDVYPVLYSQMKAVYSGQRIPFLGSVIMFIQSPAGWLCFLLILFAIIITPIVENKLLNEMRRRLALLDAKEHRISVKARVGGQPSTAEYDISPIIITSVMTPKAALPDTAKDNYIKFTVSETQRSKDNIKLIVADDNGYKNIKRTKIKLVVDESQNKEQK